MSYIARKAPAVFDEAASALAAFIDDEFEQIAASFQDNPELDLTTVAPTRPREGLIVYADGVHFDPGGGEGLYVYDSTGTWRKLDGGNYVSAAIASGSAVALSSTPANITSISLPAGRWDIEGNFTLQNFVGSGTLNQVKASISTTSATLATPGTMAYDAVNIDSVVSGLFNNAITLKPGTFRLILAATTTVYLVGSIATGGTVNCSAYGELRATRV